MHPAVLLTISLLAADPEPPKVEARAEDRLDVGALPLVNFDSDTGLGLGGNVALFLRKSGYQPYQYSLRAQAFFTTGGVQDHSITLDAPTVFGSRFRVGAWVAYYRSANWPYYGVGNEPAGLISGVTRADLRKLRAGARVQRSLTDHVQVAATYELMGLGLGVPPGSLLEADLGDGPRSGRLGTLTGDLLYDSRDVEASPTRGLLARLSLGGAHAALGSHWAYAFVEGSVSGYHSVFGEPWLVLAGRLQARAMTGDIPVSSLSALGGSATLRGAPSNSYLGPSSALANLEARSRVARWRPGGHVLDAWVVAFLDTGRVWAAADVDGGLGLHASAGGGLRAAWEEDFVVRLDVGTTGGPPRVYIDFGQLF